MTKKYIINLIILLVIATVVSSCSIIKPQKSDGLENYIDKNSTERNQNKKSNHNNQVKKENDDEMVLPKKVGIKFEEITQSIPEEYSVVGSERSYFENPFFILLKKGEEIFVYDVEGNLKKIDNLIVRRMERIQIYPSISDYKKFLLNIADTIEIKEPGMFDYEVVGKRQVLLDVDNLLITELGDLDLTNFNGYIGGGILFDSKYSRLINWSFGSPCGDLLPISVFDINNKKNTEIVSIDEFVHKDARCAVKVRNDNGYVLINFTHGDISGGEIMVLTPDEQFVKRYIQEGVEISDVMITKEGILKYKTCDVVLEKVISNIPSISGKVSHDNNGEIGEGYEKKFGCVYYNGLAKKGIDLESFEMLNQYYGKDKHDVYYKGDFFEPILLENGLKGGIDVDSFEVINDEFARDDYSLYYKDALLKDSECVILDGCEKKSKGYTYGSEYYVDGLILENED